MHIYTVIPSPFGELLLTKSEKGLTALRFVAGRAYEEVLESISKELDLPQPEHHPDDFTKELDQIRSYFEGTLNTFDLKFDLVGTEFQIRAWTAMMDIPFGSLWTYKDISKAMGYTSFCRGVGNAIGRNPIPLIIPCHRVIGSNGKLTGFSAPGGTFLKATMLRHEGFSVENEKILIKK